MKNRILSFFFAFGLLTSYAQQRDVQESAYLQLNSDYLITGETLLFSAFVTSAATGQPSPLSKILYVELVGDSKKVFQKKITLENGRGNGEFFISSLVNTGTYQLVAYTRWMQNYNQLFSAKVTIINPFESYQPDKKSTPAFDVKFTPEGGVLLAEVENLVAFSSTIPTSFSGRLTSSSGDLIATLQSNESGTGRFLLTPKAGEVYQVIIEDQSGEFHFYNLPSAKSSGHVLQLRDSKDYYELTLQAPKGTYELSVFDGQNELKSGLFNAGQTLHVEKYLLRGGNYLALAYSGDELIAERLLYHEGAQKQEIQKLKSTFATRAPVEFALSLPQGTDVSVSVKKIEPLASSADIISWQKNQNGLTESKDLSWLDKDNLMLAQTWKGNFPGQPEVVNSLPELRGEIISGRIIPATAGKIVAFSTVGPDFQIQTGETNAYGEFRIQIDPEYENQAAYVTLLQSDSSFSIEVNSPFLSDYPGFDYTKPVLDSATIVRLTEKSIKNQIENAFFEVKKDSILTSPAFLEQFGTVDYFYLLDEYNRFPKLHEHFIEYIPSVVARHNKFKSKIRVLNENHFPDEKPSLLLLDGLPVSDHEILSFSPYKIKSIGVINNRVYLGPLVADGLIVFRTFEDNTMGYKAEANSLKFDYIGLDAQKKYQFPKYDGNTSLNEIPDYREQLYWQPRFRTGTSGGNISFFTSDQTGTFEIVVDGYTSDGKPISFRQYFEVAPAAN